MMLMESPALALAYGALVLLVSGPCEAQQPFDTGSLVEKSDFSTSEAPFGFSGAHRWAVVMVIGGVLGQSDACASFGASFRTLRWR